MPDTVSSDECPHPLKVRYPTRDAAEDILRFNRRVRAAGVANRRRKRERRAYLCQCGAWHLTSQPSRPKENPDVPA